ncbi:HAD-IB family hydrolase [Clostridium sp. LBM24168]
MERFAIFDVDFTITKRETLLEFYLFMIKKHPILILHVPISLISSILFITGFMNTKRTKEIFIGFINGIDEKEMNSLVNEFYNKRLSKIFYEDAISEMRKLKSRGFKIYLISASAEFYLNTLYNIKEVDKIIGTKFLKSNGRYSNKIVGKNCKGDEKVRRLKNYLQAHNIEVDFENSYMFSDSLSDLPLLKLVGNPYLINFRHKDTKGIKVLQWK